MIVKEINTSFNSFELFKLFKDKKYPVFLDSNEGYERLGKYSIIAFDPFLVIKSKNKVVHVEASGDEKLIRKNPFKVVNKYMKQFDSQYTSDLPFVGGAIGYFSYDLCHFVEELPRTAEDDVNIPDLHLGFYNGAIIYDHQTRKTYITDSEVNAGAEERVSLIEKEIMTGTPATLEIIHHNQKPLLETNMSKPYYLGAIKKIKDYIRAGDIYQVNMTQRFTTELKDQPVCLYKKLREINPAPFSAYLDYGGYQILSSSPERFIQKRKDQLETRPIKGTRPRGVNGPEDEKMKAELKASEKDKAELLMIVDLERNDFSRVARTGTVKVPELFTIEAYPTVFHLVSTVTCEVEDEFSPIDCIEASFPGGSITGAPKIRAMEIIDELEPTQRNIYTGSIGYIDFNGDMDLNIVIRTMVAKEEKVYFQVGGGIVWDSDPEMEYQESLDKAKALIEALSI